MMNDPLIRQKAKDYLLHLFLPNTCMFCRKPIGYDAMLCDTCLDQAPVTSSSLCLLCLHSPCTCEKSAISHLLSPFYYEMGADNAVQDLKFHNNRLNARKLAIYMADRVRNDTVTMNADGIIPVPLYTKDFRKRGYNQAQLLSKYIAEQVDIPVYETVLVKTKATGKQHELSFEERLFNLTGAFEVKNAAMIQNKTLLLVDDVYTTGTTLTVCAAALLEHGASFIIGLTATKTRYQKNEPMILEGNGK